MGYFLKVVYSRACESREVWIKVRKLKNTNMLPTSKFSGTVDAEKNPVFAQIVDLYNEEGWSNQFQPYGYMATNVADTWADSMWGVALGNYTPEEAAEKVEQEIRY